ncbi:MAG: CBO0543 family protein [Anaerobacillus sp.]|uniref:CBO0543 family protein n=1 Tax=Anaerobacillus sp. TaxID=1872506 RepID=UPI00391B308D
MFHYSLSFGLIIGVLITRKWRYWKDAFIPLLFFVLFNLYYHFLCHSTNRWLWEISTPIINEFITETIYSFIIFPCWTMLFIGFFPTEKKTWYYLKWILASVIIECAAKEIGYFNYTNGWNIGWTFFFYLTMYPVLRLAQVRQILAIGFSAIMIVFYLWVFDYIPLIFEANLVDK